MTEKRSAQVDMRVYAASVPQPNMRAEAERATRRLFQLGALHAAFLLRSTDFGNIPDEHVDEMAEFIEANVRHQFEPTEWKLPDWWGE